MSKINLISLRISHHAGASGYDQLTRIMQAETITTVSNPNFVQRVLVSGLRSLIVNSGSQWYHRENFLTELNVARRWFGTNQQIYHFLYGENSYRYTGLLKKLSARNSLIATYHTPQSRFQEVVLHSKSVKQLDAVVVVSTVQQDFFANLIGSERTFYVPHGVNTQYFTPGNYTKDDEGMLRCICVGGHLRDYATLAKAANILAERGLDIRFAIVAPSKYHEYFNESVNVDLHSGISDTELLNLYQSADLLTLPLHDCTANNALLEGMACGLPVVSTDLPGVKDYVDNACCLLVEQSNALAFADLLQSLAGNKDQLKTMGEASRARAMQFEWGVIVDQLNAVYLRIN